MVKFAGTAIRDVKCAYCGEKIYAGEYVIQEGFFNQKHYHNECYRKVNQLRHGIFKLTEHLK